MSRSQTVSKQASRGFTLIELMVVIAIISVLAAISIPVFSRTRENARQTRCTANLHAIAVALRSYMTDWNGFPLPYDPVYGVGGITQLYLESYLTSNRVLRCPDDATALNDYIIANGIDINNPPGDRWKPKANGGAGEELFAERYSSYNQLFASNTAYPLYNYFGYRGAPGSTGTGSTNGAFTATPVGTGPTYAELAIVSGVPSLSPWPGVDYSAWSDTFDTRFGSLLSAANIWASLVYRDSQNAPYYDPTTTVLFDRNVSISPAYARPLWDISAGTPGNITSFFPGLVNRNAPDNTIVTHCPYHRNWFGNSIATQQDLIVRLGGDTEKQKLGGYDWVVQRQSTTE